MLLVSSVGNQQVACYKNKAVPVYSNARFQLQQKYLKYFQVKTYFQAVVTIILVVSYIHDFS